MSGDLHHPKLRTATISDFPDPSNNNSKIFELDTKKDLSDLVKRLWQSHI